MSGPLLEIKATGADQCHITPHLLPCRVHHDGSIEPLQSFWAPKTSDDGKHTAYFRGRKLEGQAVKVPPGHRGVVVEKKGLDDEQQSNSHPDEPEIIDVDKDDEPQIGTIAEKAEFDELIIWRQEGAADDSGDHYVRGMEEWLTLANQVHSYETSQEQD